MKKLVRIGLRNKKYGKYYLYAPKYIPRPKFNDANPNEVQGESEKSITF